MIQQRATVGDCSQYVDWWQNIFGRPGFIQVWARQRSYVPSPPPRFLLLAVQKSGRAWYLFSHKHGIMDDCQTNPQRESWSSRLLLYIRVTKWVYYLRCLMSLVTSACGALGAFGAPGVCYIITVWETCDCMWSPSILITFTDMILIFLSTF